jgi:hypothetical protein
VSVERTGRDTSKRWAGERPRVLRKATGQKPWYQRSRKAFVVVAATVPAAQRRRSRIATSCVHNSHNRVRQPELSAACSVPTPTQAHCAGLRSGTPLRCGIRWGANVLTTQPPGHRATPNDHEVICYFTAQARLERLHLIAWAHSCGCRCSSCAQPARCSRVRLCRVLDISERMRPVARQDAPYALSQCRRTERRLVRHLRQ